MLELWTVLLPILLTDIVNPVLFAFMVYSVGSNRPLINSCSALLGHTTAYLVFGIGLAFSFETIAIRLANPKPLDFVIGLLIGVLLIFVAWRSSRSSDNKERVNSEVDQLTPIKAFSFGAVINIIGLPFALPYFAALNHIIKANLTITDSLLLIGQYNLGYALPFLTVPVLAYLMGESSGPILTKINNKVDQISSFLMPILLAVLGIAMIVDAVLYFVKGEGLF